MYLTRLILNPRSRQVRSEISNPYEMHRTLSRAFQGGVFGVDRKNATATDILFRLEIQPLSGIPTVLVQSRHLPDWTFLPGGDRSYLLPVENGFGFEQNPAIKNFDLHLSPGQRLRFRLKASPSVKKDRPDKKQGHRVGLCKEEDQNKWLVRKIEQAGASLVSFQMSPADLLKGSLYVNDVKMGLSILAVQFEGILEVKSPGLFEQAVQSGIGSGKGFGLGLLSVAKAA